MITRTPSYKTDDGEVFATLKDAQRHELQEIAEAFCQGAGNSPMSAGVVADFIILNGDKILDILTTTDKSKPRARAINGGTKKRTPKPTATTPTPVAT